LLRILGTSLIKYLASRFGRQILTAVTNTHLTSPVIRPSEDGDCSVQLNSLDEVNDEAETCHPYVEGL
jgi:hypothetical protein